MHCLKVTDKIAKNKLSKSATRLTGKWQTIKFPETLSLLLSSNYDCSCNVC